MTTWTIVANVSQGYFETENLSDLIELTAKNIKLIYKFSGILDSVNLIRSKVFIFQ